MKLNAFKVTNFRCVQDSNWINTDDITVLVGKNEAGKTALLTALHKFKPFTKEPYIMEREWPRGHRKDRDSNAIVVATRFQFTSEEGKELESISFTNNHPKEVEIEKSYGGTLFYSFQPDDYEDTPNPDAIIKQF